MCEKENEEGWIFAQPPLFSGCLRVQSPFPTHPSASKAQNAQRRKKMGGAVVKSALFSISVQCIGCIGCSALVHWLH